MRNPFERLFGRLKPFLVYAEKVYIGQVTIERETEAVGRRD